MLQLIAYDIQNVSLFPGPFLFYNLKVLKGVDSRHSHRGIQPIYYRDVVKLVVLINSYPLSRKCENNIFNEKRKTHFSYAYPPPHTHTPCFICAVMPLCCPEFANMSLS